MAWLRSETARDRLLGEHPAAFARAGALRELGHLLNSLGPEEAPMDVVPPVLEEVLRQPIER